MMIIDDALRIERGMRQFGLELELRSWLINPDYSVVTEEQLGAVVVLLYGFWYPKKAEGTY